MQGENHGKERTAKVAKELYLIVEPVFCQVRKNSTALWKT
jgi:hypothetical protein